jgi:hypothetical protein
LEQYWWRYLKLLLEIVDFLPKSLDISTNIAPILTGVRLLASAHQELQNSLFII